MMADFPNVGEVFVGRYQIDRVLGRGGFARVYHATQLDLRRDVAIKVMKPLTDTEEVTDETTARMERIEQRFRREAQLISRFRSPNTVTVYDYGRTDGGLLYMTLEYLDGRTVAQLLAAEIQIDPQRAVFMIRQVLTSLHEAHHFDVLHRDIKPQNIMVFRHIDRDDLIKVLDFGIAKVMEGGDEEADDELTTDGTMVGTPRYMSPEQIRGGEPLGPPSDIYAVGLVLYEMITGVKAVPETTTMRIIAAHVDVRPFNLPDHAMVGEGMRRILGRMLAKAPEERFQSAREVLDALDQWDPHEPRTEERSLDVRAGRAKVDTPTIGATLAPSAGLGAHEARLNHGATPSVTAVSEALPDVDETVHVRPASIPDAEGHPDPRAHAFAIDDSAQMSDGGLVVPTNNTGRYVAIGLLLLLVVGAALAFVSDTGDESQPEQRHDVATSPTTGEASPVSAVDAGLANEVAAQDVGAQTSETGVAAGPDQGGADAGKPPALPDESAPSPAADEEEIAVPVEPKPRPRPKKRPDKPKKRKFFSVERTE